MKKLLVLVSSCLIVSVGSLSAQLYVYEGFSTSDFTSGVTVNGLGGGSGWDGNWSVDATNNPNNPNRYRGSDYSLTFSDTVGNNLVTTSGSLAGHPAGSGVGGMFRSFENPISGEVWISFLTVRTADVNWGWQFLFNDAAGETQFRIQNEGANNRFRLNADGTSALVFNNLDTAEEPVGQFYVVRVTNVGSGEADANITLWANPNDLTDLAAGAAASTALNNQTVNSLSQFAFLKDANPTGYFDELRIGGSFADVAPIPEPRAYALMAGLLGLLLVSLRRRIS